MLCISIERYEDMAIEFTEFNQRIANLDSGVALLRVIIDQYHLTLSDFPEIGGKSLVSLILSGSRQLTIPHIRKLSERFNVPVSAFV